MGNYNIDVYVHDEKHDNTYTFYSDTFDVLPGENKILDLTDVLYYESKPGYCLIPGLSQIYNRQKIKGITLAICFAAGVILSASAPLARYIYTKRIVDVMVDNYNEEGIYTPEQISDAERKREVIFNTFLISGISFSANAFLYSLIDGAVNMRRLNVIINFGYDPE